MKTTWRRMSKTILETGDCKSGSISIYFDYNLCSWLIGASFDPDPSWFDLTLDFGPISVSLIYWRVAMVRA